MKHDWDTFCTEPLSIAQGGKSVIVPGCASQEAARYDEPIFEPSRARRAARDSRKSFAACRVNMPNFRKIERAQVIILDGEELHLKKCAKCGAEFYGEAKDNEVREMPEAETLRHS
jgi:hypothetical protein